MLFWKRLCRPQGEPPAPLAASSPSTTATSSSTLQRRRKFCIYIYIFLHKHFAIGPRPFHYKRPRGACLYVLNMHTKSKKLWKRDKKCVCVCLDFYSVLVLGIWFFWVCFFSVLSLYTKSVRLICIICILKLFRFLFLLTGLLISFCDFVRSLFAQTPHQTEIPRPQINAPRCGTKSPSLSHCLFPSRSLAVSGCLGLSRACFAA